VPSYNVALAEEEGRVVREVTVMEDFLFEEKFLVTRQFGSHGRFTPG